MKHIFIVNPVAGKGKGMKYIKELKSSLEANITYIIEETKAKGDATRLARQYASEEDCIIYAVGGDGTINEVINGIIGTHSKLAIVPAGSGNDFIRAIYPQYKRGHLIEKLIKGTPTYVDVAKINEKYFLNVSSVGLDAEIARNVEGFKKMKCVNGSMAYLLSIMKTLFKYKCNVIKITIDGRQIWEGKSLLLAIANGRYYGGGIQIAPSAKVDDAKLNIYLVRELKLLSILPLIPKLFLAKHEAAEEVNVFSAKHVEIVGDKKLNINIDGEIVEEESVTIEVIPKGIEIIIPHI